METKEYYTISDIVDELKARGINKTRQTVYAYILNSVPPARLMKTPKTILVNYFGTMEILAHYEKKKKK